jgi:signal transduction histidine kinase
MQDKDAKSMKSSNTPGGETRQVRIISRWRWIILLIGVGIVFVTESIEHTALTPEYLFEFAVYGIAVAASTWILLTYLAHQLAQQSRLQDSLELQRRFSQQLAHYQDRDELAQFIVRFPGTNMPVDQVILFQYNHLTTQMEYMTEWNSDAQVRLPTRTAPIPANTNYVRTLSKASDLHEARACPLISITTESTRGKCFCLPLVHDTILVGLLRLRCFSGQQFSPAQIQFLNALSPQVALALALSIAFPRQLTEAQRAERRRLSYELHDSLAQQIGYLHLSLDRLASDERLAHRDGLQGEIERLREVADESYLQIRDNLNLLRKQDSTELVQMIDSYVRSIEEQVPFEIQFTVTGVSRPLGPITSQHVFSLIQESLNNVQKHAQAHVVQIVLAWYADQLDVTVTDDGVGFETASPPSIGRHGLTMLREHMQNLHGDMRIKSASGAGTTMQFDIPLPKL